MFELLLIKNALCCKKQLSQHDRLDDTLHRHRRHHRDRQHVVRKTCCFVTHIPNRNFDLRQPQNGPRGPKNLISVPQCFSFSSTTVPKMEENTVQNEGSQNFEKYMHFCDVHFSLTDQQILETRCIKQHAFLVDPLRDLHGFTNAHTLMFF